MASKTKIDPQQFEEFWTKYPTDRNMPKKKALQVWMTMNTEQHSKALGSLSGFNKYCRDNKWYRPVYADRFLKEERYEGFLAVKGPSEEEIEAAKDRADRLLKRGKYAPKYG